MVNGTTSQNRYNWGSGLPLASCGQNFPGTCRIGLSGVADYATYSYDNMGRVLAVTSGDGGTSTNCYSDNSSGNCANPGYPLSVVSSESIAAGVTEASTKVLDGVGRTVQKQLNSDPSCPSGTVNVDTFYDQDGRISTVSNPYCSTTSNASTSGNTTITYDGVGRKQQITHPDTSVSKISYTGRATLAADEGGGRAQLRFKRSLSMML